tara:strand:+ start:156 stop:269 length:114 start_codon:yes stop_codon:yes gene_type:complete
MTLFGPGVILIENVNRINAKENSIVNKPVKVDKMTTL